MSTRGAMGFRVNGEDRIAFNHWDSYPSVAGVAILEACQKAGLKGLREAVERFHVDGKKEIGYEEFAGIITSFRSPTRVIEYSRFLKDSLFCEWAYIINMDSNTFEVYRGFNKDAKGKGRYAGASKDEQGYRGVTLVAEYPLDKLPNERTFLADMRKVEEKE